MSRICGIEQRHTPMILQQYNARPHAAGTVKSYLEMLKWEVLHHPPIWSVRECMVWLISSSTHIRHEKDRPFYRNGIALCQKVIVSDEQYLEWFICSHSSRQSCIFIKKKSKSLVAPLIGFWDNSLLLVVSGHSSHLFPTEILTSLWENSPKVYPACWKRREWIPPFGVPAVIIMDRGIRICSFTELGKLFGFKHS